MQSSQNGTAKRPDQKRELLNGGSLLFLAYLGAVIGWVYEEDNKIGENFVDLGLRASEVDGPDIPVDFNVDGYILDRIGGSC